MKIIAKVTESTVGLDFWSQYRPRGGSEWVQWQDGVITGSEGLALELSCAIGAGASISVRPSWSVIPSNDDPESIYWFLYALTGGNVEAEGFDPEVPEEIDLVF